PLDVDGEERPHVRARPVLPALALPGLDPRLARPGHGVAGPEELGRHGVPAADVAVQAEARRLLAVVPARDHDVPVDGGRRDEAERTGHLAAHAGLQVDRAGFAEALGRLAGLRVQRDQAVAGA